MGQFLRIPAQWKEFQAFGATNPVLRVWMVPKPAGWGQSAFGSMTCWLGPLADFHVRYSVNQDVTGCPPTLR